MRSRLLAWSAAVLMPLVGAGTAMADAVPGTQAVGQTAASGQTANSAATSAQVNPSNQNISVRVLSPGNDGAVTQSNTSAATSAAANANAALQAAQQAAAPVAANQAVGQTAASQQAATSGATSAQVNPSNQNIAVRVLSPGNDGSVTQSNSSSAASLAANANKTAQLAAQAAGGGGGGGGGSQAIGQEAANVQKAHSDATSVQDHPSNVNAPTRVLSGGNGGSVDQANDSAAKSAALNANETVQKAAQDQGASEPVRSSGGSDPVGTPCGCESKPPAPSCGCQSNPPATPCGCDSSQPSTGIQAVGQKAINAQDAKADATSIQVGAKNVNAPVRVLSPGNDGSVSQHNTSFAGAVAANENATGQLAAQAQGGLGPGAVGIQAVGQQAVNLQKADADAASLQIAPTNINAPVRVLSPGGGGAVSQSNDSFAAALGLNKNATGQVALQAQGGLGPGAVGIQAIGQDAFSFQDANANALSLQLFPTNVNAPVSIGDGKSSPPVLGPPKGGAGPVDQSNSSAALGAALNANFLGQFALQV